MRKVYKYENSIIIVENFNNIDNIKRATKLFLSKAVKERNANGNGNTSGNISKE